MNADAMLMVLLFCDRIRGRGHGPSGKVAILECQSNDVGLD